MTLLPTNVYLTYTSAFETFFASKLMSQFPQQVDDTIKGFFQIFASKTGKIISANSNSWIPVLSSFFQNLLQGLGRINKLWKKEKSLNTDVGD